MPIGTALALLIAVLLNQNVNGQGLFRTVYYLPSVVSGVAVAILWQWIYHPDFGLINAMLGLIGIDGPRWLYSREWALPALILMTLWGVGGSMLIFLAGLQGIPTELYDAAHVDGAYAWRRFINVTIPMLTPTIFFLVILSIIGSYQVFTNAFVMTEGGPGSATLMLVLLLYRVAFEQFQFGFASAIAWLLFAIIMVFTLLVIRSSSFWVYYAGEEQLDVRIRRKKLQAYANQCMDVRRHSQRRAARAAAVALPLLLLGAAFFILPFLWMVSTAFKPPWQVMIFPPEWIPEEIQWPNFTDSWGALDFGVFYRNTVFLTVVNIVGTLISTSLVAFAFARLHFRGRNVLFIVLLSTMMLPTQITLIPTYVLFSRLGWINTFCAPDRAGLAGRRANWRLQRLPVAPVLSDHPT